MRYLIGIDLGTTNCCMAYCDLQGDAKKIEQFHIPQLVQPGLVQSLPILPSCCYLSREGEWEKCALELPWQNKTPTIVGQLALDTGAHSPFKCVQSAKSWLCHPLIDRKEALLPSECNQEHERISPVQATSMLLAHLREAWNHRIGHNQPEAEFEQQTVIVTVPASFDEVARALTIEAAKNAGFSNLTLLEEPQAAFYSWLAQHEASWSSDVHVGEMVLVCDVGGGTTDFSLIEVVEEQGIPTLKRMHVGDHLLLGGDNMDLALAHHAAGKLGGNNLSTVQWLQLRRQARRAKEILLGGSEESYRLIIQGKGSSVVGGTFHTELSRDEVYSLLVEGFFPKCSWEEATSLRAREAIQSIGLPYESEPSILKHLAAFLQKARCTRVHRILFNGGAMKPEIFQERIVSSLNSWFNHRPSILKTFHLDLAVARGAAYFGKTKRGMGVKVGGGTARSYYVQVDIGGEDRKKHPQALTLLPRGAPDGSSYQPEEIFHCRANTPVRFQLYTSHTRLDDQSGALIPIDAQEIQRLPPIVTLLKYGKNPLSSELLPVKLLASLSEVGTLDLTLCSVHTDHRWKLEFQLRSAAGLDDSMSSIDQGRVDETLDTALLEKGAEILRQAFAPNGEVSLDKVFPALEEVLGQKKGDWSSGLLRALSDELFRLSGYRQLSQKHALRWLNLMGFFLRPGYGYPLDSHRIKELWKFMLSDQGCQMTEDFEIQSSICYRRIAGGLNKGQQTQLASLLMPKILNKRGKIEIKGKQALYAYAEHLRAFASFERLDLQQKVRLGQVIVEKVAAQGGDAAEYWAISRIGARHPLHGTLSHVIPKEICEGWLHLLLRSGSVDSNKLLPLCEQLGRKTGHREIDLSEAIIAEMHRFFSHHIDFERFKEMTTTVVPLSKMERDYIFGDHIPHGLTLDNSTSS